MAETTPLSKLPEEQINTPGKLFRWPSIDALVLLLLALANAQNTHVFNDKVVAILSQHGIFKSLGQLPTAPLILNDLVYAGVVACAFAYFFLAIIPKSRPKMVSTILFGTIILLEVGLPSAKQIIARRIEGPHTHAHDGGVIMIEEATKMFLRGENPYTQDFSTTPMGKWGVDTATGLTGWEKYGYEKNPPLTHFAFPPGNVLLTVPFSLVSRKLFGFYDQRFLYLFLYLASLFLLAAGVREANRRSIMLVVFALNPLVVPFIVEGRTDIFVLFWVFGFLSLLLKKRLFWASVFLGMACAVKNFAWFIVPFYLLYLLRPRIDSERGQSTKATFWQAVGPLFLTLALSCGPFLVWNFPAFWEDVVAYNSGYGSPNYPVKGPNFSSLLMALGLIKSHSQYFPFFLLQILFAVPTFLFFLRRQWQRNTLSQLVIGSTFTLFVALFFNRYLSDNYLGYMTILLALGFVLREENAGIQISS